MYYLHSRNILSQLLLTAFICSLCAIAKGDEQCQRCMQQLEEQTYYDYCPSCFNFSRSFRSELPGFVTKSSCWSYRRPVFGLSALVTTYMLAPSFVTGYGILSGINYCTSSYQKRLLQRYWPETYQDISDSVDRCFRTNFITQNQLIAIFQKYERKLLNPHFSQKTLLGMFERQDEDIALPVTGWITGLAIATKSANPDETYKKLCDDYQASQAPKYLRGMAETLLPPHVLAAIPSDLDKPAISTQLTENIKTLPNGHIDLAMDISLKTVLSKMIEQDTLVFNMGHEIQGAILFDSSNEAKPLQVYIARAGLQKVQLMSVEDAVSALREVNHYLKRQTIQVKIPCDKKPHND